MSTGGYVPSRDQMAVIVAVARDLYRTIRRWQSDSEMPGYPITRGNAAAIAALFHLERSLNPQRLAWDRPTRKAPPVECWPAEVATGYAWLRNLLDRILERNRLESLSTAADLNGWFAEHRSIPEVISIEKDELKALRTALRRLPDRNALPEIRPEPLPDWNLTSNSVPIAEPLAAVMERVEAPVPVLLLAPRIHPLVLRKQKGKLNPAQYRVVKALIDAGEKGLRKAEMENLTGDAINVLKRLAGSDPDWGAVIKLPGKKGKGYRIGMPDPTPDVRANREPLAAHPKPSSTPEEHAVVW